MVMDFGYKTYEVGCTKCDWSGQWTTAPILGKRSLLKILTSHSVRRMISCSERYGDPTGPDNKFPTYCPCCGAKVNRYCLPYKY